MHKHVLALLILPMLLLGASCVPKAAPNQSQGQAFGSNVAMRVGQEIVYADGLKIHLEVINDSRCAKDVVCIWQGELSPVLHLSGGSMKEKTEVILGTERVKDTARGEYLLTLLSATESTIELLVRKGPQQQDARIRVTSPVANQKVTSPLVVKGEARGNWYFEASFPVKLLDANGKQLVIAPAQAIGEWMTTDFVPFSVSLKFPAQPAGSSGTLVLQKDNPSALPENDASIHIPVKF